VVTGGAMPAKKEGDFEMTEEPKIALPTPVMIRTNSLSEAWALAVYACSHEGKPSSPDYKNTPTLRMNMKLIIDDPMKGFYGLDDRVNPSVLHPILLASTAKTGIVTQGVQGLYAYIAKMSRRYAAQYMDLPVDEREAYCYPARLMYSPLTDKLANELLADIESIILSGARPRRFDIKTWIRSNILRQNIVHLTDSLVVRTIYDLVKGHNDEHKHIDQLSHIRDTIGSRQGSRRLKAQLWIPEDDLFTFEDQPCLQDIFFEYLGGGDVHIELNFRSWDLFNGLPFNLPGILNLIYKEVLEPNGMRVSRLTCNGRDTHIYKANWDDANKVVISADDKRKILYI